MAIRGQVPGRTRKKACNSPKDCGPRQACIAGECVSDIRDPFVLARTGRLQEHGNVPRSIKVGSRRCYRNRYDRYGIGAAMQRLHVGLLTGASAGRAPASATGLGGSGLPRPRSRSYCFYYKGRLCCIAADGVWHCADDPKCTFVSQGGKLVRDCSINWRVPGG